MQDRTLPQATLRPVDEEGQRIAIGAASRRSVALTFGKKFQYWSTQPCWVLIGDVTVVATIPAGAPVASGGSFPIPAGAVFEYEAQGSDDAYIAVIQEPNFTDAGWLFIGRAQT